MGGKKKSYPFMTSATNVPGTGQLGEETFSTVCPKHLTVEGEESDFLQATPPKQIPFLPFKEEGGFIHKEKKKNGSTSFSSKRTATLLTYKG